MYMSRVFRSRLPARCMLFHAFLRLLGTTNSFTLPWAHKRKRHQHPINSRFCCSTVVIYRCLPIIFSQRYPFIYQSTLRMHLQRSWMFFSLIYSNLVTRACKQALRAQQAWVSSLPCRAKKISPNCIVYMNKQTSTSLVSLKRSRKGWGIY